MKQKNQNQIFSPNGIERINAIKDEIRNYSEGPELCQAEVLEMWNGVFEEEEVEN